MFLNLTNHPVADPMVPWSNEQRDAAERIGGVVEDRLFPDVDADASEEEVRLLGSELVQSILRLHPAAVLVQGEYTLAFYVVTALEKYGVPCYATATRRSVSVRPGLAGQAMKESLFEFVRFRRYVL